MMAASPKTTSLLKAANNMFNCLAEDQKPSIKAKKKPMPIKPKNFENLKLRLFLGFPHLRLIK